MNNAFSPVPASALPRRFLTCLLLLVAAASFAQDGTNRKGARASAKDSATWSAEEYGGLRGEKEIQTALASKGFTWITGSPADNEKLSIGKNAQFFGFVALRYQSGRAANRGTLGRAMFSIASSEQRDAMAQAVLEELEPLNEWWASRQAILTLLEDHLYTGTPIDWPRLAALGEQFALLNSTVAVHEARAYAAFEDTMSVNQRELIARWRADPQMARDYRRSGGVEDHRVEPGDWKLLEDLYAKCFSWLSGRREDNEIIPIGQPAQFFGFVSIRHKSGHGANRGNIARDFYDVLNSGQRVNIEQAAKDLLPDVRRFLAARHRYLNQLALLRTSPKDFDRREADNIAREMGRLEMAIAKTEAEAYREIRAAMTEGQLKAAMSLRSDYIIDDSQMTVMDTAERGSTLSVLCSGCHGEPGAWRPGMVGPSLDGFWDRPIASAAAFEYSDALKTVAKKSGPNWTPELLGQFLADPKSFAPGSRMEFQGFLNPDDRRAIVEHLKTSR